MLTSAARRNRDVGMKFSTYGQHCKAKRTMPRGRVLIAIVATRFRVARNRGDVLNHVSLTNIQL